jgi:F-type H+-transporting ATPase subunit gamma
LRPYAIDMVEMMMDLATYSEETLQYALLREHAQEGTVALLAMTGDRGLAGSFNANVIRRAIEEERVLREAGKQVRLLAVGKKGIGTLRFRRFELDETWQGLSDRPEYTHAQQIARHLIEEFVGERVDRVRLIYNHFKSPMEQKLMDVTILPIRREEVIDERREKRPVTYLYEPDPATIFEGLLPAYVEIAVYRALLESSASEQGARMTAMRNASESAEEMLGDLTLALNRARQAAITQEILEVVAGAEALG